MSDKKKHLISIITEQCSILQDYDEKLLEVLFSVNVV